MEWTRQQRMFTAMARVVASTSGEDARPGAAKAAADLARIVFPEITQLEKARDDELARMMERIKKRPFHIRMRKDLAGNTDLTLE